MGQGKVALVTGAASASTRFISALAIRRSGARFWRRPRRAWARF